MVAFELQGPADSLHEAGNTNCLALYGTSWPIPELVRGKTLWQCWHTVDAQYLCAGVAVVAITMCPDMHRGHPHHLEKRGWSLSRQRHE